MVHAPSLAVKGHDPRLGTEPHVSQLRPSLGLGDHPFFEALFSDAGDVVGEEKEEEQPQDVGRQGIEKVACVWS
jgi:hypothetical protein